MESASDGRRRSRLRDGHACYMQDLNVAIPIKSNSLHVPFLPSLILARLPNTTRALSLSPASPFLLAPPLSTERGRTFHTVSDRA